MKIDSTALLPKARSEGLITKEVDGELLVYDLERDRAHCLNEIAAAIWKRCDGSTTTTEIAAQLSAPRAATTRQEAERSAQSAVRTEPHGSGLTVRQDAARAVEEQVVWLALDQLSRSHLLEVTNGHMLWLASIPGPTNVSRREAVRRIGLGAAIALPVVISMTAPTPAEAAVSCGGPCKVCNTGVDCCGICSAANVPGCPPNGPGISRCT